MGAIGTSKRLEKFLEFTRLIFGRRDGAIGQGEAPVLASESR